MMDKIDNTNTIVNLSNSILSHFGVKPFHNTIEKIDEILKSHNKIAVLLFDGLGRYIIEKHLSKDSFIRRHFVHKINATYPPTTVASTTGFLSARFPKENGWMGWFQFNPLINDNVQSFTNKRESNGEVLSDQSLLNQICPVTTIFELLNKAGIKTVDIKCYPVYKDGPINLSDALISINDKLKNLDKGFLYLYWNQPDEFIHENGVDNDIVHKCILQIDDFVKEVVEQNPDTLFLTIADHGLIDVETLDICEHEDLYSLLTRPLSIEQRTISFTVSDKEKFKKLFNKYYGDKFILLSKEETLKYDLFGVGEKNKYYDIFVGDFVALSIQKYNLYASKYYENGKDLFVGAHAGYSKEEMEINISAYNVK